MPPLRLAIAAGAGREAVKTIFDYIYAEGKMPDTAEAVAELGLQVGQQVWFSVKTQAVGIHPRARSG